MKTSIYKVRYEIIEKWDGKRNEPSRDSKNVVAKDAMDAILKVKKETAKPFTYVDEETKEKSTVTVERFSPIEVTLEAQTDF